jgi:alkylated DNA repair dioxygenase AlkB
MDFLSSVATLTFGDAAENHVGMEMLGKRGAAGSGFTVAELETIAESLVAKGKKVELVRLHAPDVGAGAGAPAAPEAAAVLVIRSYLSEEEHAAMFAEQAALEFDKKAFMYGRVVNKHARWNLCFDAEAHEPDYAAGKGRVVAMGEVPLMAGMVETWPEAFGPKAEGLKGEGNYYYDLRKCGIGWHGDTERRKVIALRLGAAMPIHFQWYTRGETVGPVYTIPLNGGDLYIMSEKAVGADWKSKSKLTLRHAAGKHAGV